MYDTILKSKQGGRFMKKMLLIALLLVGAISYGAGGLNLKFNTDGKLHEEKLLNRSIVSEDTELEIRKIGKGRYEIVYSPEEPGAKEYVSKATLKKNTICGENTCIGYDVKLKKAVFLDPEDMRVIYPEW
ncbi:hypothetical protein HMPREF9108_01132 [Leptotrichia sp. oral taxon 225 str. F0581]|nr:hypothetical protein HMPREF9108_01132 [Leptotrichia sp. oral taxon 225 str. F0581]